MTTLLFITVKNCDFEVSMKNARAISATPIGIVSVVQFSLRSFPNEPPKVQLAKGSNRMDVVGSAYLLIGFIDAVISLYLAWRYREFRKFLAGAFFVSCGTLFYLYVANVSVPLLGTDFVFTPAWSGDRAILHFILFLLCVYFGWVKKPKA